MGPSLDTSITAMTRSRERVTIELARRALQEIAEGEPYPREKALTALRRIAILTNHSDPAAPNVATDGDLVRLFEVIMAIAALAHARQQDEGDPLSPSMMYGLGQIVGLAIQYKNGGAARDAAHSTAE